MIRRWTAWVTVFAAVLALVPVLLIVRARAVRSAEPRFHVVSDMDNQPKFKAQQASVFFADGRAARLPVESTVRRGELRADSHLYQGRTNSGEWAATFPVPVTMTLMQRGQERFNIFCAPCHGRLGYGDGLVAQRADALQEGTWVPPTSYHRDDARRRAVGEIFDFISNGIRTMSAYGPQIPAPDRWAIVAYVRALQRSQNATIEDAPPEVRSELE